MPSGKNSHHFKSFPSAGVACDRAEYLVRSKSQKELILITLTSSTRSRRDKAISDLVVLQTPTVRPRYEATVDNPDDPVGSSDMVTAELLGDDDDVLPS